MKRKAIFKRIEVKNKPFMEALKASVSRRDEIHKKIVEDAENSGVLSKLLLKK